jgi:2Fe-2S ferredoxin
MSNTIMAAWITKDNEKISADVPFGQTLMHAALANNVPDILGECGGALACGTCHVIVEYSPVPLEERKQTETEMLEFADVPPQDASRLSCQIVAAKELDGLVLRIPCA